MRLPRGFAPLKQSAKLKRNDRVLVNGRWVRAVPYGMVAAPMRYPNHLYIRKTKRDKTAEYINQVNKLNENTTA